MENLISHFNYRMENVSMSIVRDSINDIAWDERLSAIVGPRGVGKTTIILQYIKSNYERLTPKVLYATLEDLYFSTHTLMDLAETFVMRGGEHLFLDEIHRYPTWSKEIKLIYDTFPKLKITISGSSLLQILNAEADLSRRCITHTMQGLSFREFLRFYKNINIPIASLTDILTTPADICGSVNSLCKPIPYFHEYLRYGYFPYYMEGHDHYYEKVNNVVNYVISSEMPLVCKIENVNVRKVQMLLSVISGLVPYEIDISKLALMMQASRNTVINYLNYLNQAKIINLLYSDISSLKKVQKPDKMYLENANMLYALTLNQTHVGTARETFAVNQLGYKHRIEYGKANGDFNVDGTYRFEVGGSGKSFQQIADIPNSYVLADDMEYPTGNKLPLWLIGLMY
ncbi:MAG: ATP-binding protein [Bacteroidales bacterium]|nr:ATP-binding protein [Bacteroidales bacterium]MBQ9338974.1 ATP-binding protein [Paludibacteraceae bacterium]